MKKLTLIILFILLISPLSVFAVATDIVNDATLSTSLVGCWDMNGTVGTAAKQDNAEGTANMDLVEVSSPTSVTGKIAPTSDGAYNGTGGSHIQVTDAAELDVVNASVAGWIKSTSNTVGLIDRYISPTAGERAFFSQITAAGKFYWVWYGTPNNDKTPMTSSTSVDDGNWHFIAVTHDGSTQKLYVDSSTAEVTNSETFTLVTGAIDFNIGVGNPVITGHPTIDLDTFAFWSKALTTAEIGDLYNNGNGIPCVATATVAPSGYNWTTIIKRNFDKFIDLFKNLLV